MFYKKEIGQEGETIATKYLKKQGYTIIERNFNCKQGEIDIIAKENNEIVFVEVKTRRNIKYGKPAESVNYMKKEHIKNASEYYTYKNNLINFFIRYDVIEIIYKSNKIEINHIKQAIDY